MVDETMDEAIGTGTPPSTEKWARIVTLLETLLALPAEECSAWLDENCGTDVSLRAELESLAAASAESASFLDSPAFESLAPGEPQHASEATTTMATNEIRSPDLPDLAHGPSIGHYRLIARLGQGGMGVVYKAVDVRLGRTVAIKLIAHSGETDVEKRRFFREAKAASALNHPNIVTIYEYDAEGAMDYIAMEYVAGTTLDRLATGGALPLKTLLGYAAQIADALARAHEAGIAHRDLKPGNIMVTSDGVVKVLDFGLARYVADTDTADSLTRSGVTLGTPAYMSPEQAMGEAVDRRSDIFSFGIILYELACGCHPFRGPDRLATLNNIVRQAPASAATVNPAIPNSVVALIERCLHKRKEERVQSLAEVSTELLAAGLQLETDAVAAATARSEPPKGIARRRAIATVGVLLSVALGGGLWWARVHSPLVLTYRLEVQKKGDAPREASSGEIFHAGDRFRLRIEAPQTGFLYLINEGPGPSGRRRFWVLYPPVSGSAALAADRPFETGWNVFDLNPGTERLWLVFAREPSPLLQDALAASEAGEVKDPAQTARLADFMRKLEQPSKSVVAGSGVRLQAAESVLGEVVQLRHE